MIFKKGTYLFGGVNCSEHIEAAKNFITRHGIKDKVKLFKQGDYIYVRAEQDGSANTSGDNETNNEARA